MPELGPMTQRGVAGTTKTTPLENLALTLYTCLPRTAEVPLPSRHRRSGRQREGEHTGSPAEKGGIWLPLGRLTLSCFKWEGDKSESLSLKYGTLDLCFSTVEIAWIYQCRAFIY